MSNNLDDFLFYVFDWFRNFNYMIDDLFNFHNFRLSYDLRISQINFFNYSILRSLNDWFFDNLCNFDNSFLEEWNLNNFFNFLDNFSCLNNRSISDNLDFFKSFLNDDFLSYDWYFIRLSNNSVCLNNLLNDLWNLNNFFNSLNDRNWFLNNSINNLMSYLNMIFYLFCISVFNLRNNFFNNFFDLNNLWDLNDFFNKFLNNHWNFNNFFYNFWF